LATSPPALHSCTNGFPGRLAKEFTSRAELRQAFHEELPRHPVQQHVARFEQVQRKPLLGTLAGAVAAEAVSLKLGDALRFSRPWLTGFDLNKLTTGSSK
jgi:hypothetical protein